MIEEIFVGVVFCDCRINEDFTDLLEGVLPTGFFRVRKTPRISLLVVFGGFYDRRGNELMRVINRLQEKTRFFIIRVEFKNISKSLIGFCPGYCLFQFIRASTTIHVS